MTTRRHVVLALLLTVGLCAPVAANPIILITPFTGVSQSSANNTMIAHNDLYCVDFIAEQGITNATQVHWRGGASGTTGTQGVALYSADGSTQLFSATWTGVSGSSTDNYASVTTFSLTSGTGYRLCFCSSVNATYLSWTAPAQETGETINALGTVHLGIVSAGCSTGVPPSTASTLTAPSTWTKPPIVTLGTDAVTTTSSTTTTSTSSTTSTT